MKTRDQLLKKARKAKHDSDWTAVKAKRKEVKNSVKLPNLFSKQDQRM